MYRAGSLCAMQAAAYILIPGNDFPALPAPGNI